MHQTHEIRVSARRHSVTAEPPHLLSSPLSAPCSLYRRLDLRSSWHVLLSALAGLQCLFGVERRGATSHCGAAALPRSVCPPSLLPAHHACGGGSGTEVVPCSGCRGTKDRGNAHVGALVCASRRKCRSMPRSAVSLHTTSCHETFRRMKLPCLGRRFASLSALNTGLWRTVALTTTTAAPAPRWVAARAHQLETAHFIGYSVRPEHQTQLACSSTLSNCATKPLALQHMFIRQMYATALEAHSKSALMLSRTGGLAQQPAGRAAGRAGVRASAGAGGRPRGAQPAIASTLLPMVGLLSSLTRLELPSVAPPLKVRI